MKNRKEYSKGHCGAEVSHWLKFSFLFLFLSSASFAQLFEFAPKDVQRLRGRTAVLVLPDMKDAPSTRDPKKIEQQKAWIAKLSKWWEAGGKKGWNSSILPLIVVKRSAVDSLPKDKLYLLMEPNALTLQESFWQTLMPADSATVYVNRTDYQQKQKFAYLQLRFSEKNDAFYTWYFFTQVPTVLDYFTATRSIGYLIQRSLMNPKSKTKNIEAEIRERNSTLKSRTLFVDSILVNRVSKKFEYIPEEYKEPFVLSNQTAIEQKILSGDESGALFFMVPISDPIGRGESYTGTSGGGMMTFEKNFFFMQLILDLGTGNLLYYDKTEEPRVLVKDWKRFTRYTDEEIPNSK